MRTVAVANQTGIGIYAFVDPGKSFARRAKLAFSSSMADFDRERDGIWDEDHWERFLQQQDQKTEKYMELLEKYIDDPQRDEIVAREMGWCHLNEENAEDWNEEVDSFLDEAGEGDESSSFQQGDRRKLRATRSLSRGLYPHDLDRSAFSTKHRRCKMIPQRSSWRRTPRSPPQNLLRLSATKRRRNSG